jgi:hypothetical protein
MTPSKWKFPGTFTTIVLPGFVQAQHIEMEYYDTHFQPGADLETHASHMQQWHDQRLRVFVSSTLDELAPERAAAREAITQMRLTPVLFESGARPYPPHELYQAYLAHCDVFLGVYWQRYGRVAPGMQISGLEDEYQLASDKPKLIYLKLPAPEREPALQRLVDRIRTEEVTSYKKFSTAEELGILLRKPNLEPGSR